MFQLERTSRLCVMSIVVFAGCQGKKEPDPSNFKAAINDYYEARPECIWASPVKLPVQADTKNDAETKGFDALTDAGLLMRKPEEKKRFLVGSKQVNSYDISDKGRSAWTPDQTQPGYGNFCFGHRQVTSVDTFTTATGPNGVNSTTVNYHYEIAATPEWAQSPETKTAFPNVQAALAGPQAATSKLVQTQNGWQVAAE
jgi:hypothetical protein